MTQSDLSAAWSTALRQPGVGSDLGAARDAIDAVRRMYRRPTPSDTARALLAGADASAQLDGAPGPLDGSDPERDAISAAAARVNGELPDLATVIDRSPLQALARLHVLATDDATPEPQRGRPAPGADLARLTALLRELGVSGRPALATALLAHAEVVAIAPFVSANNLIGRAVERLLLISSGVDPQSLVDVESGHLALQTQYRDALARYADGGPLGCAQWLQYGARATTLACEGAARRAKSGG